MDEGTQTKLTITGKIAFSEDITLTQAGQIIAFIDSTLGQSTGATPVFAAPAQHIITGGMQGATQRGASPREIIERSGAKTNAEKIVAFASLIANEENGGKDVFTADDIRPLFRRARESTPANFSRDFEAALKNGWIDESETKGEYYLTQEAYEAIEKGFGQIKKPSSRKSTSTSKTTKTRKTVETPEVFKKVDPIPNSLDGVAFKYNELKVVNDKFLWVLALGKSLGADGLTADGITWVTDHLGAGIQRKHIKQNFDSAQKKSYVNKSTLNPDIIRITDIGVAHLKALKSE